MKMLGMTLLLAVVATAAVLVAVSGANGPEPPDIAADGTEALSTIAVAGNQTPAFSVTDLEGNTISSDKLEGKVTYLNFFATWCGYCLRKWPHVESEIWERFKDDPGFQMASVGRQHSAAELREFKARRNIQSPLAPDPKREVYLKFAKEYSPRGVVIGPDGIILEHVIWYDPERMEKTANTIAGALKKLKELKE